MEMIRAYMKKEISVLPMLCETYNEISQQAYKEYIEAITYLKSLGLDVWDYCDHTKEQNEKYTSAMHKREKSAITAIVFQALAVEAFINLFGAQRIGEATFYTQYECRGSTTLGKLKKISKEFLHKPYPTEDKAYSMLTSLLNKRDYIVHTKPKAVTINGEPIDYDDFMSQTEYIYKNIDGELECYEKLKRSMASLEGKDRDLIQENLENTLNVICDNISYIYYKTIFGGHDITSTSPTTS